MVPRTTTFKAFKDKNTNGTALSNGYQESSSSAAPETAANGVHETVYPDIMDVDSTAEASVSGPSATPVNGTSATPIPNGDAH